MEKTKRRHSAVVQAMRDRAAKSGVELINVGAGEMDGFMQDKTRTYTEGRAFQVRIAFGVMSDDAPIWTGARRLAETRY